MGHMYKLMCEACRQLCEAILMRVCHNKKTPESFKWIPLFCAIDAIECGDGKVNAAMNWQSTLLCLKVISTGVCNSVVLFPPEVAAIIMLFKAFSPSSFSVVAFPFVFDVLIACNKEVVELTHDGPSIHIGKSTNGKKLGSPKNGEL